MRNDHMADLVRALRDQRLLIIGDVMLDENLWGEVRRVSPEAPVPVVELTRSTHVPGGAANNAANAVALGGRPFLGGVVGDDPQADQLRQCLSEHGVDASGLRVDRERPTTTKTRIVAHSQHVVRVDRECRTPISPELEGELLAWANDLLPTVGACIISDYAKGVVSPRLAADLIRCARQAGIPVVVDPKGLDYCIYRGADVVTPNLYEAERAARLDIRNEEEVARLGHHLDEELGGSAVLITRGNEGMTLFTATSHLHIPAEAHAVFDVTGAGDTAITTLALSLGAGASLEDAARLANRAAGIVVGKVGTAVVSHEELLDGL